MPIVLTYSLVVLLSGPAAAERAATATSTAQSTERERLERERERLERERARVEEQLEREREREQQRAEQQRERDQQRAEQQRERDQQRAEQERERARAQQERDRSRQGGGGATAQADRITRTLKLGESGELDIANISGDITITRGGGSEATVEIVKNARARSDQEAKEQLQLVNVEILERGTRTEIRTHYPSGRGRRNVNVSVAITVAAPAGTRVRVNSISGSLSLRDIRGEAVLETISGNIRVAGGGALSSAKSISGNIEITNTETDRPLEASTASGTVTLRHVKAQALDVGSISGGVVLDDVQTPRLEAQVISGEVSFSGPLVRNGRYELGSHSGAVRVAVTGGSGFQLEATSFSGSVQSDFPLAAQGRDPARDRRSLRGTYGDGSAILELTSFSGSVVVSKR
jgi:DUF4097 and DUF4098 domain-containing protein YvlB